MRTPILAMAALIVGLAQSSFGATIARGTITSSDATTPEPGLVFVIGTAILGLGVGLRRLRSKSNSTPKHPE